MNLFKRICWIVIGCGAIATGAVFMGNPPETAPVIWWFLPAAATPGTPVLIVGRGLRDTSLVTFGGTRAGFAPAGPMAIRATVPARAATGPVSVTTPEGTAISTTALRVMGN